MIIEIKDRKDGGTKLIIEIKGIDEKAIDTARLEKAKPGITALLRFALRRFYGEVLVKYEDGYGRFVKQSVCEKVD